jgi:uncharacterized protein (TIGR03437 family)
VTIGNTTIQPLATALVTVGEFQIDFQVPQLPDGDYPISIQINGVPSPLYIAGNTDLPFVFPIRH